AGVAETPVRKADEQTVTRVSLLQLLHLFRYSFFVGPCRVNNDKPVVYFLAVATGRRLKPEPGFDEARWVTREEAMRLLQWKNDKEVVARAFEAIRPLRR